MRNTHALVARGRSQYKTKTQATRDLAEILIFKDPHSFQSIGNDKTIHMYPKTGSLCHI